MWAEIAFGIANTIVDYTASKKAQKERNKQIQDEFNQRVAQAEQSWFRTKEDLKLEQERITFENKVATENAAFSISTAKEAMISDISRVDRDLAEATGSQKASAGAAGIRIEGSTWAVLNRSVSEHAEDVSEIKRNFMNFTTATNKERDQYIAANDLSFSQYKTRTLREADYEIANLLGKYNTYNQMSSGRISTERSGEYQTGDKSEARAYYNDLASKRESKVETGLLTGREKYFNQLYSNYGTIQ